MHLEQVGSSERGCSDFTSIIAVYRRVCAFARVNLLDRIHERRIKSCPQNYELMLRPDRYTIFRPRNISYDIASLFMNTSGTAGIRRRAPGRPVTLWCKRVNILCNSLQEEREKGSIMLDTSDCCRRGFLGDTLQGLPGSLFRVGLGVPARQAMRKTKRTRMNTGEK